MSIERSSVSIIILVSLVSIPNGKLVAKYSLISQLDLKVLNSNNNFYSITHCHTLSQCHCHYEYDYRAFPASSWQMPIIQSLRSQTFVNVAV